MKKSTIRINGVNYTGNHFTTKNGKLQVDGKYVALEEKEIHVSILGDIEKLEIDHCEDINIIGNVKSLENGSGDVKCGDVQMLKSGSGDVECQQVFGDVRTGSGDVSSKSINGKVTTGSGDVRYEYKEDRSIGGPR